MSLHAVLDAIRAAGDAQVREIEQRASTQARALMAEANMAAQEIQEKTRLLTSAPAYQERARIHHRARLEGLRTVGSVREDLVDGALDRTRGRLSSLRTDPSYPGVLLRLIHEALAELEGPLGETGRACLQADPRDKGLLDRILPDLFPDLPVSYDLNCWGGLIARSEDGRVVVINTLEARLERATPYLRRSLAAFFEAGQTDKKIPMN